MAIKIRRDSRENLTLVPNLKELCLIKFFTLHDEDAVVWASPNNYCSTFVGGLLLFATPVGGDLRRRDWKANSD